MRLKHHFAVGVVFFPPDIAESHEELEQALAAQNCDVLAWRDVPTRPEILGEIALSTMPVIRHVLITSKDPDHLNRRLYLARKQFERSGASGYVCSSVVHDHGLQEHVRGTASCLSSIPISQIRASSTPFAVFHQRYATNVAPSWDRAQPFRMLCSQRRNQYSLG